jgi:glycosyltransferase involved in cell wall biosynthesis
MQEGFLPGRLARALSLRVCLVSSLRAFTGNSVTALRVAQHLRGRGCEVALVDADADGAVIPATDVVIALHAFRSGRLLLGAGAGADASAAPTIVVLSGTDLNSQLIAPAGEAVAAERERASKADVALRACMRAAAVVVFGEEARERVERNAFPFAAKTVVIPQAVSLPDEDMSDEDVCARADSTAMARVVAGEVDSSEDEGLVKLSVSGGGDGGASAEELYDVTGAEDVRAELGLPSSSLLLLLVCGLRAVKSPLYVAEALSSWRAATAEDVNLLIIGPELEADVARAVRERTGAVEGGPAFGGRDGLYYHAPVARSRLLRWMAQADVVVNSSESEGQSNTLLEAFLVGTPVVARRNAGNVALVGEGADARGLLYDDCAGFEAATRRLLGCGDSECSDFVQRAREYALLQHGALREAEAWTQLVLWAAARGVGELPPQGEWIFSLPH